MSPRAPIEQYYKDGNLKEVHASIHAAADKLEKPGAQGNIVACCKKRLKSAYGYVWRYQAVADVPPNPISPVLEPLEAPADHGPRLAGSYIAGFFDGDGSVNISLVGPQGKQGYLLKAELTQCNRGHLEAMAASIGAGGKLYKDTREGKYSTEAAWTLRYCGKAARPLLHLVAEHGILKAPQALEGLRFLDLPRMGRKEDKEAARAKVVSMNQDKLSYAKDYSRLSPSYIAGLFDAEGNVYHGQPRKYVKITQRSDPVLLERIRDFVGCGYLSEGCRWKVYSRKDIREFYDVVVGHSVLKLPKLTNLVQSFQEAPRLSAP